MGGGGDGDDDSMDDDDHDNEVLEENRSGIYCHSKVFMVQATRLFNLTCNRVSSVSDLTSCLRR